MRLAGLAVAGVLLAACGSTNPDSSQLNVAVQALHQGQVVDSVPCLTADLPTQHMHVHLGIYVDGQEVKVPAGIGVGRPWGFDNTGFLATGSCFAWMHTHDASGVIHIVTPGQDMFKLGQLFSLWGQPLGRDGAFDYRGAPVVLVDGRAYSGDPRGLVLRPFENIVIELGKPPAVPPASIYDFGTLRR